MFLCMVVWLALNNVEFAGSGKLGDSDGVHDHLCTARKADRLGGRHEERGRRQAAKERER
jgi:hypothetical protein